jgi:hypothetical protein
MARVKIPIIPASLLVMSMKTIAKSLPASKYSSNIVETALHNILHGVAGPDLVTHDGFEQPVKQISFARLPQLQTNPDSSSPCTYFLQTFLAQAAGRNNVLKSLPVPLCLQGLFNE